MARITLTKKQLATDCGAALLELLRQITADGAFDGDEADQLRAWLDAHGDNANTPAIAWLRELVTAVLLDGRVTDAEKKEMLLAIERVMPVEDRVLARIRRQTEAERRKAEQPTARKSSNWEDDPVTDRQLAFIETLGIECEVDGLTKGQASKLITARLEASPVPSNRQMMVLRFWSETERAADGKTLVSDWMDGHAPRARSNPDPGSQPAADEPHRSLGT